jgi:hypothetical protein
VEERVQPAVEDGTELFDTCQQANYAPEPMVGGEKISRPTSNIVPWVHDLIARRSTRVMVHPRATKSRSNSTWRAPD